MIPSPSQEFKPIVSPRGAPVDGEVTVTMTGLPPAQSVRIGFGSFTQNQGVGRADADAEGKISVKVRIPEWAERDGVHFFFASFGGLAPRSVSEPFLVTDPEGVVRVSGLIIASAGATCVEVVGSGDTVYALSGDLRAWHPGLRVQVVGTVGEEAECGGVGVPILVREIRHG